MTQQDRDNLFILMVMYNKVVEWSKSKDTELTQKDKNKLVACSKIIMDLFIQYRKNYGDNAFKSLCDESKEFTIAVISKGEDIVETIKSFEPMMVKDALKNIMKINCDCNGCNRCDYTKCDWFTIHKFIGSEEHKGKGCPFNVEVDDIFKVEL